MVSLLQCTLAVSSITFTKRRFALQCLLNAPLMVYPHMWPPIIAGPVRYHIPLSSHNSESLDDPP